MNPFRASRLSVVDFKMPELVNLAALLSFTFSVRYVCIFTSLLYIVNNDEEIHSSRLSFLPFSTHIKTMLFLHYLSSLSSVALIYHVKLCCVEVNVAWRMSVRGGKWQKRERKRVESN